MKQLVRVIILLAICCYSVFAGTITVLPSSPTVPVGGSTSVNVNVAGLTDLYAFQFDVIFNPTVLSAVSVTEGSLFSSVGVFFSPGTIDNTAGTVIFIADSLSGPGPGISLDGTLAQITFSSIGVGLSGIDLANVILLNSGLNDISADASGSAVTVTASSPEPSSMGLLVTGLGLGCLLRRRLLI